MLWKHIFRKEARKKKILALELGLTQPFRIITDFKCI